MYSTKQLELKINRRFVGKMGYLSRLSLFCCLLLSFTAAQAAKPSIQYQTQPLQVQGQTRTVKLPVGYRLEVLSERLRKPRLLHFYADELFVGSKADRVYRLRQPYTSPEIMIELDDYPHSVARLPGKILIAQTNGVYIANYKVGQARLDPKKVKKLAALPDSGGHNSRTVAVGPDGRIYASLGISGNCSDEYLDPAYKMPKRRGGVLVWQDKAWQTFASGLRNPVGFDWHPETKALYASNNGPDHLGYDSPPEYFSLLEAGSFHGMPWFYSDGKKIRRDACLKSEPPRGRADVTMPVVTFPARNAPMGVAFVAKGGLEMGFYGDAIVALHGSWATKPNGAYFGDSASRREPKLVVVRFENGKAQRVDDLITGFQLANGERWARPVGVALGPDGALYFSSDAGAEALFRLNKIK